MLLWNLHFISDDLVVSFVVVVNEFSFDIVVDSVVDDADLSSEGDEGQPKVIG